MMHKLVFTVAAGLVLGACTMSPVDGQTVGRDPVSFYGYAVEPGAIVRVQTRDPSSGIWQDSGLGDTYAVAATVPTVLTQNYYYWATTAAIPVQCFGKDGLAHVRVVEELYGKDQATVMFDQEGRACLDRAMHSTNDLRTLDGAAVGQECSKGRTEVALRRGPDVRSSPFGDCRPFVVYQGGGGGSGGAAHQ